MSLENMDGVLFPTGKNLQRQAAQECLPSGVGMDNSQIGKNELNQEPSEYCNFKAERKLLELEKAFEEVKKEYELKSKECTEVRALFELKSKECTEVRALFELKSKECTKVQASRKELQDELVCKTMHVRSLVERLVEEKSKSWSSLQGLTDKFLLLKSSHFKLLDEAKDFQKFVTDFDNMVPKVHFALSPRFDLEKQHEDLKLKYVEGVKERKDLNNQVRELKEKEKQLQGDHPVIKPSKEFVKQPPFMDYANAIRPLSSYNTNKPQVSPSIPGSLLKYKCLQKENKPDGTGPSILRRTARASICTTTERTPVTQVVPRRQSLMLYPKPPITKTAQDKGKDLESQQLVERWLAGQNTDTKIVEQQLQEDQSTMEPLQASGKQIVGRPSLLDQVRAIRPLSSFNSNKPQGLPPKPGSLLKYKCLQKENKPDGAAASLLRRTARASIATTSERTPVTQFVPRRNSLIPFPPPSTTTMVQNKRITGMVLLSPLSRAVPLQKRDINTCENISEIRPQNLKIGSRIPKRNSILGQSIQKKVYIKSPLSSKSSRRMGGVEKVRYSVGIQGRMTNRVLAATVRHH